MYVSDTHKPMYVCPVKGLPEQQVLHAAKGSHARHLTGRHKGTVVPDPGMHADATTQPKAQARPAGPPNPLRRAANPCSHSAHPTPPYASSLSPPTPARRR